MYSTLCHNVFDSTRNERKDLTEKIDFAELCITSKATINYRDADEVSISTKKASGEKCPICWKINIEPCSRHSS